MDKTIPIRTLNKSADKKQKPDPLCVYIQYGFSPIELYCHQNRHEEVLSVTNTHDLKSQRLQYYNHVFHSNDEAPLQFPHPADSIIQVKNWRTVVFCALRTGDREG